MVITREEAGGLSDCETDLVECTETVSGRDDPPPVEERPAADDHLLRLQEDFELHHPGPVENFSLGQASHPIINSNIPTLTVTFSHFYLNGCGAILENNFTDCFSNCGGQRLFRCFYFYYSWRYFWLIINIIIKSYD